MAQNKTLQSKSNFWTLSHFQKKNRFRNGKRVWNADKQHYYILLATSVQLAEQPSIKCLKLSETSWTCCSSKTKACREGKVRWHRNILTPARFMNHIGDRSTTTTPAVTLECSTPLRVWESGERKWKGHPAYRGQRAREELPPRFSRQQTPAPLPAVHAVGHLLALPFARRCPAPGRGTGRGPRRPSHTPRHHTRQDWLEVPAAPPPSFLRGKPGQNTAIPRHETRPEQRDPLPQALALAGPRQLLGPRAHTAPTPPATRPRRAPHAHRHTDAQIPLLTHSAARNDGTTLPGCRTARPGPPRSAWPSPAQPDPPGEAPTRLDPAAPQHRPQPPDALCACAALSTNHRAPRGGGSEARLYHAAGGACLPGAFLRPSAALSAAGSGTGTLGGCLLSRMDGKREYQWWHR